MKIYAFDVDDTLELSSGAVSIKSIADLKPQGDIVGLNGNWAVVFKRCRSGIAFSARWANGNIEGHLSEPAKNAHPGRRLHHGRKHQRGKWRIR